MSRLPIIVVRVEFIATDRFLLPTQPIAAVVSPVRMAA